jgi:SM-20-related protein
LIYPQNIYENLIDQVVDKGYAVGDGFLKEETLNALFNQLQQLREEDALKAAGIGQLIEREVIQSIRGDQIHWISKKSSNTFEQLFNRQVEAFSAYLNRSCFLSLNDYEFHYTCYPAGTFYKKHIDRFQSDRSRILSLILYLNKDWEKSDGGEIAVYPNDEAPQIIEPQWGRVVCFKSDELAHEVLPTQVNRYSVTGWLKSVNSENIIQLID